MVQPWKGCVGFWSTGGSNPPPSASSWRQMSSLWKRWGGNPMKSGGEERALTLPALYLWAEERPTEFAVPELLSVERMCGARPAEGGDRGTLFSAGLVAGEGLCGIVLALLSLV